jgi:hypothetical protein
MRLEIEEKAAEELVLQEVISLLPARVTVSELLLCLSSRKVMDKAGVYDAIRELRRFGLLRFSGNVLEPTLAAFRAADLFTGTVDD